MTRPTLFAIGYEGADLGAALVTLERQGVTLLVDVRDRGYSKTARARALEERGDG
ncbi:MAG: hypothetical protein AB1511_12250 [Deinococcota bacterium]